MSVYVQRKNEFEKKYVEGLSRIPVLVGACSEAEFYRCSLKAGQKWQPELYPNQEKYQLLLFTEGTGYVANPRKAFNITETAVFVPEFDREWFFIQAATDLEFFQIVVKMSDYDRMCMREARMTLPRFRQFSEGWTYYEDFKSEGAVSRMLLEHRNLGRVSMGTSEGVGPGHVGDHIHNELEQWYIALPGSNYTYIANGTEYEIHEGDLAYSNRGTTHGSRAEAGQAFRYIWFELCVDGYPGEIK